MNFKRLLELVTNEGDRSYANVISPFGYEYYCDRVLALGLVGNETVVDIGSGFGQWSMALSEFNGHVIAFDPTERRIEIARQLAKEFDHSNVEFHTGYFNDIKLPDHSVDLVFCYGVYMFLDRHEFERKVWKMLKPGGRVFICTNDRGWWLHTMHKGLKSRSLAMFRIGFKGLFHYYFEGSPNSTSISRIRRYFPAARWEIGGADHEGHLSTSSVFNGVMSTYQPKYFGLNAVIEFLVTKKPGHLEPSDALELEIRDVVAETLARTSLNWMEAIREQRFIYGRGKKTAAAQMKLLGRSTRVSRVAMMRIIYQQVTAGKSSELEKVLACYLFVQKHFVHSFAGQPLDPHGRMIFDPITVFMISNVRCGNSARFLIDLMECNGHAARLLQLGCHVSAEVQVDDRWCLADTDLFFPGWYPRNANGDWATLQEAAENPAILDVVPSYVFTAAQFADFTRELFAQTEIDTPFAELGVSLYPSSAYFAKAFYTASPATISKIRKLGTPSDWDVQMDFGWSQSNLQNEATVEFSTDVGVHFRPTQVKEVKFEDGQISWAADANSKDEIIYSVYISPLERNWSYDNLPVACSFEVSGSRRDVSVPRIEVKELSPETAIVIVAKRRDREQSFHLPSTVTLT